MADWPTLTIETPFGPLVARLYAGPTMVPGTIHASDGKYPSTGHAFDRDPDPAYVSARVGTADHYGEPDRKVDTLIINGVPYTADVSFARGTPNDFRRALPPDPSGWYEEFGSFGALTRLGSFVTDTAAVTDGARKAWRERVVPLIIAALTEANQEVALAADLAAIEFRASVAERIDALRAEADRLADLIWTMHRVKVGG